MLFSFVGVDALCSSDDLNNGGPISTDYIGGSDRYPNASYAEREMIFQQHKLYTQVSG